MDWLGIARRLRDLGTRAPSISWRGAEAATIRRHLLTLSASAALHVGALGLALTLAGAEAVSAIRVDLVMDVESEAVDEARARSSTVSQSGRSGRAPTAPALRMTTTPAARVLSPRPPIPAAAASVPVAVEAAPEPEPQPAVEPRSKNEPPPEPGLTVAPIARLPDPPVPSAPVGPEAPGFARASEGAGPAREAAAVGAASGAGAGSGVDASAGGSMRSGSAGPAAGGNASSVALATPGDERGGIPPEYGPYLQRFRQRVQESLEYPRAARRQGLTGRVELEVQLEPSGRIGAVRVISSSSHAVLDDAALQAVKRMTPEPLPEHLPRRLLRIRLPLGFELE